MRQLQDDLKSVFMRGVCTLNFEAMQLLSGNPVPFLPVAISAGPSWGEMLPFDV